MPALRELQAAIGTAMLGGDAGAAAREIESDGLAPEARLEIYRHHVLTTLTSALEATFPVICRLVDRRFFAYAADTYVRAHPPTGPCLFEYGDSFPDFLAAFPPCRDLAYLPDVARLEWAMNVALHAPDADALDPACLVDVAAEDMPRLTFAVDPSVSFLDSPWPVERIWRANQDGASSDPVDLASGDVRLEVRRAGDVATVRALAAADYALRTALTRGGTLEDAAAAALGADSRFDLTTALHALLDERIFTGFAVSN
jgi:hypothetical protein